MFFQFESPVLDCSQYGSVLEQT